MKQPGIYLPQLCRIPSANHPAPPAPRDRARRRNRPRRCRRSRRDRAAETAQDYVEAIADLSASLGEARWWIWRGGWA